MHCIASKLELANIQVDKGGFLFVTATAHGVHLNDVEPKKKKRFEKYLFL